MNNASLHIAVVDDHSLFLEGICNLLERLPVQIEITGYSTPVELLDALSQSGGETLAAIDLLISDLIMKEMNGAAFASSLRKSGHRFPILIVSGLEGNPPLSELKRIGVNGFVHKSADHEVLFDAILKLLNGQEHFTSKPEMRDEDNAPVEITNRQREILKLVQTGFSNKEIGERLFISESTVKTHLANINNLLGVNNRLLAVTKAVSLGLI